MKQSATGTNGRPPAAPRVGGALEDRTSATATAVLAITGALAALIVALLAIRPDAGSPLSYDAYAVTVHFDRIVSGHHLEDVLGTTPKPLLTVAFGLAHAVGGWTGVALVSILAWSASVGLATALAARLGGIVAGVAAAVLLIASPTLLLESAWGLGTVWAIGLWSAAGLAAIARPPRWWLCGVLLGLAALVRVETLLIVGLGLAVILGARLVGGPRPGWRRPLAIAAGLLALPVMLAHDALLTGDPLYWTTVSASYGQALAAAGVLPTPDVALGMVRSTLAAAPVLTALAAGGAVLLVRDRRWPIVVGLAALGPGIAIALPVLAASGRLVDARYLEPIRFTVTLLAALAIGWGVDWVLRPARTSTAGGPARYALAGVAVLAAVAVAVLATPVVGPTDAATASTLARFRALSRTAEAAEPALLGVVAQTRGISDWPGSTPVPGSSRRDLFAVPGNIRPRLALDLGLPLTRLVATNPASIDLANGQPSAGEIVVHSGGDLPAEAYAPFELDAPASTGSLVLTPVLSDPGSATWVVRVDGVGGSPLWTPTAR